MSVLGDFVVSAQPGFACGKKDDSGVFQFRMNNISRNGALMLDERRRVPVDAHKNLDKFHVAFGDVLFNATNSPDLVGKSAVVRECLGEPAVFSNHFTRLRTQSDCLDPAYLARWLQWGFGRGVFRAMCRQWVNQATVSRESLMGLRFDPPDLDEQRRIAAILDHANALRAKRRQVLDHLDSLTQSIFLDMFGDPVSNPRNFDLAPLNELGKLDRGVSRHRPRNDPALLGGRIL